MKGGFVSVGTSAADINLTDRQLFSQSFTQFGNSTTLGGLSAFNLEGFFSATSSGDGSSSQFLNENIYLLGGDGSTIQKSKNYFLINTGKIFKADSPLFAETVDLDDGTLIAGENSGAPVGENSLDAIQLKAFEKVERKERKLSKTLLDDIKKFPKKAHPMDVARTAVSIMGLEDKDTKDNSPKSNMRKVMRIFAKTPVALAAFYRIR